MYICTCILYVENVFCKAFACPVLTNTELKHDIALAKPRMLCASKRHIAGQQRRLLNTELKHATAEINPLAQTLACTRALTKTELKHGVLLTKPQML